MLIYFLPAILALGVVTSYEDIKEGKIRNFHVLAAISIGVFLNLLLFFLGMIPTENLFTISLFFVEALFIGVAIWIMGYWSPGDAKLFTAFSILIPPEVYINSTTEFAPIDLLINIILPVFIYLFTILLIRTTSKQKVDVLKSVLNPKNLFLTLLAIFSLS
jgi:Flp pilus assembly protein protease CpaA